MSAEKNQKNSAESGEETRSPEEIEAGIEKTREELGDTMAAIADKADIKKQAGRKAEEVKEKFSKPNEAAGPGSLFGGPEPQGGGGIASNPVPLVVGAFVVGLVIGRFSSR